ncbi:hypothetical protein EMIT019CA3_60089 [Bacillus pseudomycoides]
MNYIPLFVNVSMRKFQKIVIFHKKCIKYFSILGEGIDKKVLISVYRGIINWGR